MTIKKSFSDYNETEINEASSALIDIGQKLVEKKDENVQATIYHYTSPEGLDGILSLRERSYWGEQQPVLRFSRYDCLNDLNEGEGTYKLYSKILEEMHGLHEISEDLYNIIRVIEKDSRFLFTCSSPKVGTDGKRHLYNDLRIVELESDTYLCCFSKDPDSLPMWNYYIKSGGNKGYNIGISKARFVQNDGNQDLYNLEVKEVIYDTQEQKTRLRELILLVQENFTRLGEHFAIMLITGTLNTWRFLFKNECFEHEKEVRAILKIPLKIPEEANVTHKFNIEFRSCNGYIIPYVELPFPQNCVQAITMGPLLDFPTARTGLTALLASRDYKNVSIFESQVPMRY